MAGSARDVRIWWGTRDDWVGETDQPAKAVGDLTSDGTFVVATDFTGNAVQITSGSEGVLLFSPDAGARALVARCCTFSNIVALDPFGVAAARRSEPWPATSSGAPGESSSADQVSLALLRLPRRSSAGRGVSVLSSFKVTIFRAPRLLE